MVSSARKVRRAAATPARARRRPPAALPRPPPSSEINRLSVSICRTRRQRPAPSAARTAISRCRAVARASSRLAALTQAISSTSPTAPSSTSSMRCDRSDDLLVQRNHQHASSLWSSRDARAAICAHDRVQLRCRLRRRHPGIQAADAFQIMRAALAGLPSKGEGYQTSTVSPWATALIGRCRDARAPAGITPTTVYGCASSMILRPRMSGVGGETACATGGRSGSTTLPLPGMLFGEVEFAAARRLHAQHAKVAGGDRRRPESVHRLARRRKAARRARV